MFKYLYNSLRAGLTEMLLLVFPMALLGWGFTVVVPALFVIVITGAAAAVVGYTGHALSRLILGPKRLDW